MVLTEDYNVNFFVHVYMVGEALSIREYKDFINGKVILNLYKSL